MVAALGLSERSGTGDMYDESALVRSPSPSRWIWVSNLEENPLATPLLVPQPEANSQCRKAEQHLN